MNHRFFGAAVVGALLLALSSIAFGAERYKDPMFEYEVTKDWPIAKDVPYLSAKHTITSLLELAVASEVSGTAAYFYENEYTTEKKPILVDIYMPKKDTATNRSMVIVSHGGAFVAGHKDDTTQKTVTYCDSLAARGYVVFSLEYRLGVTLDSKACPVVTDKDCQLTIDSVDFARTVYRGVQDIRAAVRYARYKAKDLAIDPNKIYLIGNSAGAILSLENIYSSSKDDFPTYIDKEPLLGDVDEYGEMGYDARANGAAALWGAVHNIDMIKDNKTPVLLIHGTDDGTVYFKTGRPLSNVAGVLQNLMPETAASLASIALDLHAPTLYGSYVIDSILTAQNVEHLTYFVEGMKHEFYDDGEEYEVEVRQRVFNFLYNLSTEKSITSSVAPVMLTKASVVRMGLGNKSFSISAGNNLGYLVADLRGRSVMKGKVSAGSQVDLSGLSNGVYVLQVQGEKALRFAIQK